MHRSTRQKKAVDRSVDTTSVALRKVGYPTTQQGNSQTYGSFASIRGLGLHLCFRLSASVPTEWRERVARQRECTENCLERRDCEERPRPRVRRSKPPPGSVGREKEKPRPWVRQGRPPAQSGERKKSPGPGCGKAAPRHRRAKDDSPGTTGCGSAAPRLCRAKIGRKRARSRKADHGRLSAHGSRRGPRPSSPTSGRRRRTARAFSRCRVTLSDWRSCSQIRGTYLGSL